MATCAEFAAFTGPIIKAPCAPVCILEQILANLAPLIEAGFITAAYGKYRSPETEDLDENLKKGDPEKIGIFHYDIKSSEQRTQTTVGQLNIQGLLQVFLPSDITTGMECAYNLAEMVKGALAAEASFFPCSSRPTLVTYVPTGDTEDDKIMQFEFQASYNIPMTAAPL